MAAPGSKGRRLRGRKKSHGRKEATNQGAEQQRLERLPLYGRSGFHLPGGLLPEKAGISAKRHGKATAAKGR